MTCDSVDKVTGLRCKKDKGHTGLCSAPTGKHGERQYWGTVTIPGEVLDEWEREAREEADRG